MSAGWIYFARFSVDGPIKIGRAINPHERRTNLATSSPVPIVLLGAMHSERVVAEEAELHERLCAHRVRGEWFVAEPVLHEMRRLASRILAPEDIKVEASHLHIRPFLDELELWKSAARTRGMTLTAWLREILNAHVLPEDVAAGEEDYCRGQRTSAAEKAELLRLQEETRLRMEDGPRRIQIMLRLLRRLQMDRLIEKLTASGDQIDLPLENGRRR